MRNNRETGNYSRPVPDYGGGTGDSGRQDGSGKERYSSGQKFVMDAGKLLERGKLIDIRLHTRFIRFPAHSHNYVEMIYMCQGSTVHTINGDRIELKTGELLILNQNAVQEIEPAGRDDIAVNFLILPEFLTRRCE